MQLYHSPQAYNKPMCIFFAYNKPQCIQNTFNPAIHLS